MTKTTTSESPIRYQPNIAKEWLDKYLSKKPTAIIPATKAIKLPTSSGTRLSIKYTLSLTSVLRVTPSIIGSDAKKLYSAAAAGLRPASRPAIIVEPDLETPGISAKTWVKPIKSALHLVRLSPSLVGDALGSFSKTTITTPTRNKVTATTVRLPKNTDELIKSDIKKPITPAGIAVISMFIANLYLRLTKMSLKILIIFFRKYTSKARKVPMLMNSKNK